MGIHSDSCLNGTPYVLIIPTNIPGTNVQVLALMNYIVELTPWEVHKHFIKVLFEFHKFQCTQFIRIVTPLFGQKLALKQLKTNEKNECKYQ